MVVEVRPAHAFLILVAAPGSLVFLSLSSQERPRQGEGGGGVPLATSGAPVLRELSGGR